LMEISRERGAAAVEFALVGSLLILLLLGILDGGRLWMVQSTLSQAAREGARDMAINNAQAEAEDLIESYSVLGDLGVVGIVTPATCSPGAVVRAEAQYAAETMLWGLSFNMVGRAEMRCGG